MDDLFKFTSQVIANDQKIELQKQNEIVNLKNQLKNFNYFVI